MPGISTPLGDPERDGSSHTTEAIDAADINNVFRALSLAEMTSIFTHIKNSYPDCVVNDLLDKEKLLIDKVTLVEPRKSEVKAYMLDNTVVPTRQASVAVYDYTLDIYTSQILTLSNEVVSSYADPVIRPYIKPSYNCFDEDRAIAAVLLNQEFRNRIFQRLSVHFPDFSFDNSEHVSKLSFDNSVNGRNDSIKLGVVGNFLTSLRNSNGDKRIMYLTCHWNDASADFIENVSFYTQPFINFVIYVDTRKCVSGASDPIIKFVQSGADIDPNTPLPSGNLEWTRPTEPEVETALDYIQPIVSTMPNGPSYTFNGRKVNWDNWEFTWSFSQVYGLMLYDVSFMDKTVWKADPNNQPVKRSILYKGHIPELLTAYGDAEFAERNFFDISEYPARDFMIPVIKGLDCPNYANLFDVTAVAVDGSLFTISDAIALYEIDGGVAWRHTDYPCVNELNDLVPRGRTSRKLVLASNHVISNYDYMFQWIFSQDGGIEVKISPSGIVECSSQPLATIAGLSDKDLESLSSSTLVQKYIAASNHAHIGVVRLDFEIDRDASLNVHNVAIEKTIACEPISNKNVYGGKWREIETELEEECFRTQSANIITWGIKNPSSLNYVGYPRSYEIEVDKTPLNIFHKNESVIKRAEYLLNHSICFTKYHDDEQFPIGEFVGQAIEDSGLKKYIEGSETISDENIVAWAITGFAHAPRAEDYPVMPLETFGLKLKPENFFNENPLLYIKKQY
jgi:Cu2+-containing amine oxidase